MFLVRIKAIAFNTLREAIRDKILYSLMFFALLMIGSSVLIGKLSLGEYTKIIEDIGMASISLFGTLIAVFIGIQLVNKEIDKRTVYTLLSKPVHRYEFMLGKFFGLSLTLLLEVLIMTAGLLVMVWWTGDKWAFGLLPAVGLIYMEMLLLTAFALLFSSFSTPMLSGLFTLSIFVIGHLTDDIKRFGQDSDVPSVRTLSEVLYYVLPNLENFNLKNQAVHDVPLLPGQLEFSLAYGILYAAVVLAAAIAIFQRRDFK